MLSNAQIKFIRSLQQKKFRQLHSSFVAEGDKIVGEMLQGPYKIKLLCALPQWLDAYSRQIPNDATSFSVSPAMLSRISGLSSANQVVAVAEMPDDTSLQNEFATKGLSLYLDGIQDPGNMGTIIRTADWFGVKQVFCSPDTADVFNPKVIQASMGSFCRVQVFYDELPAILAKSMNKPIVYGASLDGDDLFKTPLDTPAMVVIGNESKGISPAISHLIHSTLRIPGAANKTHRASGAESLNASVAAAIFMAWFGRSA